MLPISMHVSNQPPSLKGFYDLSAGAEELERERGRKAEQVQVKEEPMEEEEEEAPEEMPLSSSPEVKQECETPTPEQQAEKDSLNLFLQKPGSFSKLSKLLEVAKMSPEPGSPSQSHSGSPTVGAMSTGSPVNTPTTFPSSPSAASAQPAPMEAKPDLSAVLPLLAGAPYLNGPGKGSGYPQALLPNDQLFRVLTEKSGHWFSLLPRSPCDSSSLTASPTHPPAPQAATSTSPTQHASGALRPKSPSSLSPNPPPAASSSSTSASPSPCNPGGSTSAINNFPLSPLQVRAHPRVIQSVILSPFMLILWDYI